jgi:hypothetical protein
MQLLFHIVTEDFLVTLRTLLAEIQRLASAALDASYEILAVIFGP